MSDDDVSLPLAAPTGARTGALVCAIGAFLFSFGDSREVIENGVVIESSHHDYVAAAGGGVAVILGAVALYFAAKSTSQRGRELGLASLAVALGVVHVVVRSGFVL